MGELPLCDLQPHPDRHGKVSKLDKKVYAEIESADTDKSGSISSPELYNVFNKLVRYEGALKFAKQVGCMLTGLLALSIAGNAGMGQAVAVLNKESTVAASGVMLANQPGQRAVVTGETLGAVGVLKLADRRFRRLAEGFLLQVAEIKLHICLAADAAQTLAGHVRGAAALQMKAGGQEIIVEGVLKLRLPDDGLWRAVQVKGKNPLNQADTEFIVKIPKNGNDAKTCPVLELREETERRLEAVAAGAHAAWVRRRLEDLAKYPLLIGHPPDAPPVLYPDCELFHCFEGDEDCDDPSARDACVRWTEEGDRCAEPGCRLVHKTPADRCSGSSSVLAFLTGAGGSGV